MGTLVVVVLSISAIIFLVFVLSLYNNTLYLYLHKNKDFNLYRKLMSIPLSHYHFDKTVDSNYHYIKCDDYPNYRIILSDNKSFISENGTLEYFLCPFYKRGTKKLYKKLILLVENK